MGGPQRAQQVGLFVLMEPLFLPIGLSPHQGDLARLLYWMLWVRSLCFMAVMRHYLKDCVSSCAWWSWTCHFCWHLGLTGQGTAMGLCPGGRGITGAVGKD